MTVCELHVASPTFRALMAEWVAARRAPYCLADFLREQELDDPEVRNHTAVAARAKKPRRAARR